MLKLYGGARSRAAIVRWYLEELAVPYEFVLVDLQLGEQRQPDFLAINPFGKVPAIVDGDCKLWESGAILLYLAGKYDPAITTIQHWIKLAQWIIFTSATFKPAIYDEARRSREMPRLFTALDHYLEQHPFLVNDRFSGADVALGTQLAFIIMRLGLDFRKENKYASVITYFERLEERTPFQQTFGERIPPYLQ
jgi:glutathione S-transferase